MNDFGMAWPISDGENAPRRAQRLATAQRAASQIASLASGHQVCVQAGGHVGLWPLFLSRHFAHVYTFEPDIANWACLVENVTAPNVYAARGVLGATPGGVSITRTKEKSGLWRTVPGGPIPTYTVDGLALPALDALVLDVEGDEWAVIQGAMQSILQYRPVVWFEARMATSANVIAWLCAQGYAHPQQAIGRDLVMQVAA